MEHPLVRGWRTLSDYPSLALVPLGWEAITVGSASLLGLVSHAPPGRSDFQWPVTLPAGAHLLGTSLLNGGRAPGQLLLFVATVALNAMVTAGFLHLIAQAMRGEPPSWYDLVEGVQRFGWRLVQWRLVLVVGGFLLPPLLPRFPPLLAVVIAFALIFVMVQYYLVEFLIPVRAMTLREALSASPRLLSRRFGAILVTGVVSLLLSGALSYALTANHLRSLLIASPIWCFLGTWMTASICAAVTETTL